MASLTLVSSFVTAFPVLALGYLNLWIIYCYHDSWEAYSEDDEHKGHWKRLALWLWAVTQFLCPPISLFLKWS